LLNIVQRPDVYEEALIGSSEAPIALSVWRGERLRGELLAVRGETVTYRSIWTVALTIAFALIRRPGAPTCRAGQRVS
jgi:hypothetical protein